MKKTKYPVKSWRNTLVRHFSCIRIAWKLFFPGLVIRSSVFRGNRLFFPQKWANERFAQKTERIAHSLIFGERERFAHDHSFPLSDLSKSLMVAHFWWATCAIRSHRSFLVSDLSDSLTLLTKKRGNERIAHKKKNYTRVLKTYKK